MSFQKLKVERFYAIPTDHFECRGHVPRMLSDIQLHLPILQYFASKCESAVELGVRDGHSTVALMTGLGKSPKGKEASLISYDIETTKFVEDMMKCMGEWPCKWLFKERSSIEPPAIEETDLLFLDTLHTFVHISQELAIHGRQAKKYLVYHDTTTCGARDLSGSNPNAIGILPAIMDFMDKYPNEYVVAYDSSECNGLLVLERK